MITMISTIQSSGKNYQKLILKKYRIHLLYFNKLVLLKAAPTIGLICILLLFTQCEPLTDAAPQPAELNNKITTTQTVTTVDGEVTLIECSIETLASGEIIKICVPANWNGELILYAHGYVPESEELVLPDEADVYIPLFTSFGFAFATTSFRTNGLAILSGIEDMIHLRSLFIESYGLPEHTYLTGGSQGGIITTLAIEQYPDLFSGGLSLCGPCGYFQGQVNYYGNFRVLFDYFFPGVLPGNAVNIPNYLMANWESTYVPLVLQAIAHNPQATIKLLRTAQAPFDPDNPTATIPETVISLLTYNVLYSQNGREVFGGQPYDNRKTVYFGTGSVREDFKLNLRVQRFSADKSATQNIKNNYETSGNLKKPLVMAHTTLDPIQLFWHLPLYQAKTVVQGKSYSFIPIPIQRYGHCTFTEAEAVRVFALLVLRVKGEELLTRISTAEGRIVQSVSKPQLIIAQN